MTSKRSLKGKKGYIPFMEISRRRIPVIALTALYVLIFYCLMPIIYLKQREISYRWYYDPSVPGTIDFHSYMEAGVSSVFGLSSMLGLPVAVLAVITAIQGFHWLYKSSAVDFYFSQPIRKRSLFFGITLNSISVYGIITAVGTLICGLIGAGFKGMSGPVALEMGIEYLRLFLFFSQIYLITTVAVFVSKNTIVALVVDALILFAEGSIRFGISALSLQYYTTFLEPGLYLTNVWERERPLFTGPIINHFFGVMSATGYDLIRPSFSEVFTKLSHIAGYEIASLVFGAICLLAAFWLFEKRRAEAIGSGVIYRPLAILIKAYIGIGAAVISGIIVDSVFGTANYRLTVILVIVMAVTAAICCCITEIVDAGSMRGTLKSIWHIPVVFGVSVLVIVFFKYDLSGFDSYIPKEADVEDGAVYVDWYNRDKVEIVDGEYVYCTNEEYYYKYMHLKDVPAILELTGIGEKNMRDTIWTQTRLSQEENIDYYEDMGSWVLGVTLRMKDGSHISRRIMVPNDIDNELMDRVVGNADFTEAVYQPIPNAERAKYYETSPWINYNAGYGDKNERISAAEFEKLMEAYKKDLEQYDYTFAMNNHPVGLITYTDSASEQYIYLQYEVYESYSNTINCLKEAGVYLEPGIPVDRIEALDISEYNYDENGAYLGTGTTATADPDIIKQIAENAYNNEIMTLWSSGADNPVNLSFNISPGMSVADSDMGQYGVEKYSGFVIDRKYLPDSLISELESNIEY